MQMAPFGQTLACIKRGFPNQGGQDMMIPQSSPFDNLKKLSDMGIGVGKSGLGNRGGIGIGS